MLRIILVDDSKEDLLLAQRVVSQCNLLNPVTSFRGADDLAAHIERVQVDLDKAPEPSVVLLDLIMAPTSGLEALRHIQKSGYARHCLVIMVSGLKDIKAINEGYQLGAKTFLLKPLNPRNLVEVLNALPDRILIEQSEKGYILHLIPQDGGDTQQFRKRSKLITLTA